MAVRAPSFGQNLTDRIGHDLELPEEVDVRVFVTNTLSITGQEQIWGIVILWHLQFALCGS